MIVDQTMATRHETVDGARMTYPAGRRAFLAAMLRFTAALPFIGWSHAIAQQRPAHRLLLAHFEGEMRLGLTLRSDLVAEADEVLS